MQAWEEQLQEQRDPHEPEETLTWSVRPPSPASGSSARGRRPSRHVDFRDRPQVAPPSRTVSQLLALQSNTRLKAGAKASHKGSRSSLNVWDASQIKIRRRRETGLANLGFPHKLSLPARDIPAWLLFLAREHPRTGQDDSGLRKPLQSRSTPCSENC